MNSILEGLNKEQLEATTFPSSSSLILAGAGSGKTRVLTTRIAWLIQTGQINPFQLMAVTFTNKAAREMLVRISSMLPINTRGMWVGTFHGLCNRMLRSHHQEAKLPQTFQILDSADQLSMIKRVMKSIAADENKYPYRQVQYFINSNKEEGLRASQVDVIDEFSRNLVDIYEQYDRACQREGVVDFSELLLRSFELLSGNERLLEHYRSRFRHILVDEFQDTNKLQYAWLRLLKGVSTAVMAVGDDDQSIYAFRGARTGNMLDFEKDFGVQKIIRLEQNYRSHGNILDAANALISNNDARLGKNLWTDEGKGEPIRLYSAATDSEEASFLLEEVQTLAREGIALNEIALLYRSNAQSRILEHTLFKAGMSYRVYGGLRFFERQEVKHALAYLRLIANPNDDGAFLRVVNFPTRGIGNRTLESIQDISKQSGTSLWQATCSFPPSGRAGAALSSFVSLIENIKLQTEGFNLPDLIEHVIESSGLIQHYQKEREGQDRIENLKELVNASTTFVKEEVVVEETNEVEAPEMDPLTAFLAHASLEAGDNQAQAGEDALQLMTVHSAKGLEFNSVFISGLEEGIFPHENSLNEQGGLEEERRLMYVAMTRARRRLYLSYSQIRMLHGQTRYNVESRFVEEIPSETLKRINSKDKESTNTVMPRIPNRRMAANIGGFRIGQQVSHPKFGIGVIVQADGNGQDAMVQVNFSHEGLKWLALEFAKLSAA
ncbi:MAG: DNA helicase II [Betaproteobacteria bacterium]